MTDNFLRAAVALHLPDDRPTEHIGLPYHQEPAKSSTC
jgi:hypothetical protein